MTRPGRYKCQRGQQDIEILQRRADRTDARLEHGVFDVPEPVVDILQHNVNVTEVEIPTVTASAYNNSFTSNNSQAIFYDAQTVAGGFLPSGAIKATDGTDRARRKLFYINDQQSVDNAVILRANDDAALITDLVIYRQGEFFARQFVPAVAAGSTVSTQYIAEDNGSGSSALNPIDIVPGVQIQQVNGCQQMLL